MRDPNRISEVLAEIERLWRVVPDWRLGQLIVNVAGGDPFFIEDSKLIENSKAIERIKAMDEDLLADSPAPAGSEEEE